MKEDAIQEIKADYKKHKNRVEKNESHRPRWETILEIMLFGFAIIANEYFDDLFSCDNQ